MKKPTLGDTWWRAHCPRFRPCAPEFAVDSAFPTPTNPHLLLPHTWLSPLAFPAVSSPHPKNISNLSTSLHLHCHHPDPDALLPFGPCQQPAKGAAHRRLRSSKGCTFNHVTTLLKPFNDVPPPLKVFPWAVTIFLAQIYPRPTAFKNPAFFQFL